MSLLTELDAFYTEHRRCGALDGGIDGATVWGDLRLRRQHGAANRRGRHDGGGR